MTIPEHLVDLVRELAERHHREQIGNVCTIEAYRSKDHHDSLEARDRLRLARDLCAFVQCSVNVAA